jgi:RNA polymerase sigma factor (sigma-70 family)
MTQVASLTDNQLISAYISGNEGAFATLLNRHKNRIYTAIYLLVRDEDLAHDLFQDTFIKIIDTLRQGRYNEQGKFLGWALRIAHNICIDHIRRKKVLKTTSEDSDAPVFRTVADACENVEELMIRSHTHDTLRAYIDRLQPEQREVLVLRHYANLPFKEIADLTRVSLNTALGRMRYALLHIRKMMQEAEAGAPQFVSGS